MKDIKISIIVPVYNTEIYLRRCLDSLVNQTLKEIEIICVNDQSPDHSAEILVEYEERYKGKVIVITTPENLKQGGARNLGIKAAQGKYVGFIDSDDWVELDMYKKLFNLTTKSEYEIIYCDLMSAMSDSGPFIYDGSKYQFDCEKNSIENIKKHFIMRPNSIVTGIYSRALFIRHNLYFPQKLFYEDNYLSPLLVSYAQNIKKINEPLVYYFQGNISTTRSFNNYKFFDRTVCARLMLKEIRKRGLDRYYKEELEFYFIETFLVNTTIGCMRKFFPVQYGEIKKLKIETKKLIPNYKKNYYLNKKIHSNFYYRVYIYLLRFAPFLLIIIFTPYSFIKYKKSTRKD